MKSGMYLLNMFDNSSVPLLISISINSMSHKIPKSVNE